jgi:hypothetical protein
MEKKWSLDENGISLIDSTGKQILDLRNECHIESMSVKKTALHINFLKIKETSRTDLPRIGQKVQMRIENLLEYILPEVSFPLYFEGIYDISTNNCSLCIGASECVFLHGENVSIKYYL